MTSFLIATSWTDMQRLSAKPLDDGNTFPALISVLALTTRVKPGELAIWVLAAHDKIFSMILNLP
jgi:hypothetical protein